MATLKVSDPQYIDALFNTLVRQPVAERIDLIEGLRTQTQTTFLRAEASAGGPSYSTLKPRFHEVSTTVR